jgi:hypothetical protein
MAKLEERVANHIKFFEKVFAVGVLCIGGIFATLFFLNGELNDQGKLQADNTSRIVGGLLSHKAESRGDLSENLSAASTILKTAKVGKTRPDLKVVMAVSDQILAAQDNYSDLPEVWRATSNFINYKYIALLLPSSLDTEREAVKRPC